MKKLFSVLLFAALVSNNLFAQINKVKVVANQRGLFDKIKEVYHCDHINYW